MQIYTLNVFLIFVYVTHTCNFDTFIWIFPFFLGLFYNLSRINSKRKRISNHSMRFVSISVIIRTTLTLSWNEIIINEY